ncbi:Exosome complex component RRP46 [Elsinoe australis]|uniref:Exosome complex component RRP46 n=1 Tax=Elsinoe australis TaxID=40998 RepID=A0A2P7YJ42_9PEZI|nr:Exosome complex component RRP46 [Elsinoe australis]
MAVIEASLGPLHRADGSATYSHAGYSVICAVNGPIEVQRRDEIPDEAAIEVNVRPAVGVGGPKERHLETLIHSTLRHLILIHLHPRTLIQITLQILTLPESESDLPPSSHTHLIPPLLNASSIALLHAAIPLSTTLTSTIVCLPHSKSSDPVKASSSTAPITDPSPAQLKSSRSSHVFAFASNGDVVLAESEGVFTIDEFERAGEVARGICLGEAMVGKDGDVEMEGEEEGGVRLGGDGGEQRTNGVGEGKEGVMGLLEGAVGVKVREGERWRGR